MNNAHNEKDEFISMIYITFFKHSNIHFAFLCVMSVQKNAKCKIYIAYRYIYGK